MSSTTRLFVLICDSRKASTRLEKSFREKKHEYEGVHFACGSIALENGVYFESLYDMEQHFERVGTMNIQYQDEQEPQVSRGLRQLG